MTVVSAGTRLAATRSPRVSVPAVWGRAADGSDEERRISNPADYSMTPSAVSPDGTEVLVHSDKKDSGTDVEVMDRSGTIRSLVRSDADDDPGTYSPDGRWIAYWSDESGQAEVYVRP